MRGEFMSLKQAAEHVQIDANELKHAAQRGEVDASVRGGEWYFDHAALDEWAQRSLLASNASAIANRHRAFDERRRRERRPCVGIGALLVAESIDLSVPAKAKAGMIRDMTDLADRSGFVYDPSALFKSLVEREEAASTAVGEGVAFLHPRYHDPYVFEQSFVAYGRSERPIFFGAPDGGATRHFFLICSTDHEQHLHVLARLAVLAHGTNLVELLDAAETPEDVLAAVAQCEDEFIGEQRHAAP